MAMLSIMLVLMAAVFAVSKLAEGMGYDIDAYLDALTGLSTVVLVAGMAVVALVMVLISYSISAKIVEKKEY